ncbi:hypothetical protein HaLaN_10476, partial [Haematococcus lacustris]
MSSTMPQLRSLYVNCPMDVDEGSLAACTQLTTLLGCQWFPALTQLTQLQQLEYVKDLSSDSLPLLATLPQLVNLSLLTCPLQPSSQLSRFLFQHLTSLTVDSIHSRDLAALDCPQLQTLTLSELQVDSAASLRACASGILHHCNDIYKLFTYDHGQEFKSAAAGAELTCLDLITSPVALAELQLLAARAQQAGQQQQGGQAYRAGPWLPSPMPAGASCMLNWVLLAWAFARAPYHHHQLSIYKLFTYNHGKEFKEAAAGAGVRQLGLAPSASVLLEALAPWQPR